MSINQTRVRPLSWLKRAVVGSPGRAPRICRFGLYQGLTLDLDLEHETQIWLGLWERETYSFIRRAAKRCRWAVDVGAGHGELCVYLLSSSHADMVIAIEPQREATDRLRTNIRLSGDPEGDRLRLLQSLVGASEDGGRITLDSLDVDRTKPGFIKIDVDGAECDVLDGTVGLLSAADVSVLVETHSQELERGCIDRLDRVGYSCRVIRNAWWRVLVPERRLVDHNRWLWAEKPVSRRIASARR